MKIALRRRHASMIKSGACSHKIDFITIFRRFLILKGIKTALLAILLNRWIFPIGQSGEASRWRVCYQRGLRKGAEPGLQ